MVRWRYALVIVLSALLASAARSEETIAPRAGGADPCECGRSRQDQPPERLRRAFRQVDRTAWLLGYVDKLVDKRLAQRGVMARAEAIQGRYRQAQVDLDKVAREEEKARREASDAVVNERSAKDAVDRARADEERKRGLRDQAETAFEAALGALSEAEGRLRKEEAEALAAVESARARAPDMPSKPTKKVVTGSKWVDGLLTDVIEWVEDTSEEAQRRYKEAVAAWKDQPAIKELTRLERKLTDLPHQIQRAMDDAKAYAEKPWKVRDALTDPKTYRDWATKISKESRDALAPVYDTAQHAQEALQAASEALTEASRALPEAIERVKASREWHVASEAALEAHQVVKEITTRAAADASREMAATEQQVREVVASFLEQEVVVYRIGTDLSFSFNAYTGAAYATLESDIAGLKWDSRRTEDLLRGNARTPDIEPLKLAVTAMTRSPALISDDYEDRRAEARKEGGATYFASKRFVRWAGADTVAKLVAKAIAGQESDATQEVKDQILLEYNDLLGWLRLQGQPEVEAVLPSLLAAALTGHSARLPQLDAGPARVRFAIDSKEVGATFLPKAVRDEVSKAYSPLVKSAGELVPEHLAFWVRWRSGSRSDVDGLLERFDEQMFQGRTVTADLVGRVMTEAAGQVSDENLRKILAALATTRNAAPGSTLVADYFSKVGLTEAALREKHLAGESVIDLSSSPVAERIVALAKGVALGN